MAKCFELPDSFPVIEEVIGSICQRSGEATQKGVVTALVAQKQGSFLVRTAIARCPDQAGRLAGNMAAWFSRKYTDGALWTVEAKFKRRQIKNKWAYSFR